MQIFEMSSQDKLNAQIRANEVNKKTGMGEPGEKNGLGKDSFLKLLVTQLRHQDPTRPMEDREFVAQMAQFSTLEQMTNLNNEVRSLLYSARATEAYGVLGKHIDSFDSAAGIRVSGRVNSIFYRGDELMLKVGNEEVSMRNVHSVKLAGDDTKQVNSQDSRPE